jgi:hypothetical protein
MYREPAATAVDASGNTYVVGRFTGTEDMDPGPGVVEFTSAGGSDIYVSKFDAAGNHIWSSHAGGTGMDVAFDVCTTTGGKIYVTGSFEDHCIFNLGSDPYQLLCNGTDDMFIWKLDGVDGSRLWLRGIGGPNQDEGHTIASDASGNVFVAGTFSGSVDMDPNAGSHFLSTGAAGHQFLLKLTAGGVYDWSGALTGSNFINVRSIATAANGDLLVAGYNDADMDADLGTGTVTIPQNSTFLINYNNAGDHQWSRYIGEAGTNDMALDAAGNILVCGDFSGPVDFDPGIGTDIITGSGDFASFIWKLDPQGNHLWARSLDCGSYSRAYSITADSQGRVITTGPFDGDMDADPGPGVQMLPITGISGSLISDVFVSVLDASGNFAWAGLVGGSLDDVGVEVRVDGADNIYLNGHFTGDADLDPGSGTATCSGPTDQITPFLIKLDPLATAVPEQPLANVQLYPMPVTEVLHVNAGGRTAQAVLFDANGRMICARTLSGTMTGIDMHDLPAGAYLLQLSTRDERSDRVVLKQ